MFRQHLVKATSKNGDALQSGIGSLAEGRSHTVPGISKHDDPDNTVRVSENERPNTNTVRLQFHSHGIVFQSPQDGLRPPRYQEGVRARTLDTLQ